MATLALLLAYSLWLLFVVTWGPFARFTGTAHTAATPQDRSSGRTSRWGTGGRGERLYSLVIAAGIVLLVLAPLTRGAARLWVNPAVVDGAMLLAIVGGIAWCWWARVHLARFWSPNITRKDGHHIVDTGPYRLVRHPIYSGFIVIYLGMAIICTTALALLAVPVMTFGLWLKARLEERFLIEELGAAAYDGYGTRTPMLIPTVTLAHRRTSNARPSGVHSPRSISAG